MDKSDESLLDSYFEGDARAFEAFFRRHNGRVIAYAMSKGLSREMAKELAQEAFLRLHRHIHRYEKGRPALPWFFTIVHNSVIDMLRKNPRHEQATAFDADEFSSPERKFDDAHALLAKLPQAQRQVVEMRAIDELSFKEIAAATGKSDVSLRKLFERARLRLKQSLKQGNDHE